MSLQGKSKTLEEFVNGTTVKLLAKMKGATSSTTCSIKKKKAIIIQALDQHSN